MLVESPYPIRRTPSISPGALAYSANPTSTAIPAPVAGTASFKDRNGRFYLFGGLCLRNGTGSEVVLNDLWSYEPDPACLCSPASTKPRMRQQRVVLYPNPAR